MWTVLGSVLGCWTRESGSTVLNSSLSFSSVATPCFITWSYNTVMGSANNWNNNYLLFIICLYVYSTLLPLTGKHTDEHLNTIQTWNSKPHIVYADWLVESLKLKRPADEAPFAYTFGGDNISSPLQRIKLSTSDHAAAMSPDTNNETYVDEEILKQYIPKATSTRISNMHDTSHLPDSQASDSTGLFSGKWLEIHYYPHVLIFQTLKFMFSQTT